MVCKNCGKKVFAKEFCQCGEKAPNIHGAGVAFNSVICTIVLVFSVIFIILTMALRNMVNNNILVNTVKDIDLCSIEIKDDSGKTIKLDEYIYNNYIDDDRIKVENVDNVLKDPFIKDFVIEKLEGYQAFVMDEGEMIYITADDIVNLIDENSDLLYNEAGLNFLEPDKEQLRSDLNVLDQFSEFSENYMTGWFSSGFIQTFFSFAFIIFLGALMTVVLIQWILVYKLNSRRIGKVFRKYSIAMIIPSFIIAAASFSFLLFGKNSAINEFMSDIKWTFAIPSGIMLGTGVVLLLVSILLNRTKETSNVNLQFEGTPENAAESVPELKNAFSTVPETPIVNEPANTAPEAAPIVQPLADVKEEISLKDDTPITEDIKSNLEEVKVEGLCPQCGHQNKTTASFCSKCGTKIK